jgi:ribosomal protein S18 acetylase RimI-like enzyme
MLQWARVRSPGKSGAISPESSGRIPDFRCHHVGDALANDTDRPLAGLSLRKTADETADERMNIVVVGAAAGRGFADEVGAAYRAAFAAPPNNEGEYEFERQRSKYRELLDRPGFQLATARLGGVPAGFAYGVLLRPDTLWWEGMREPLAAEVTAETGSRTFALIDLGVRPEFRRRGLGRALHDAVLGSTPAERATLAVEPRLEANQRLYRSWGWVRAGRMDGTADSAPYTYDIYILALPMTAP